MNSRDVLILGAGASGLMCASEAAARGRRVLVLDHGKTPGQKILVSGGGRCNFTNLHATPSHYVTQNPEFVRFALSRFTPRNFVALLKARHIPFHEKTDGQLFCDAGSRAILQLLLDRAREGGVEIRKEVNVREAAFDKGVFTVRADQGEFSAPRLVVATGGLSWPTLGASDLGLRIALGFGLRVVETFPALVGFAFPGKEQTRFQGLAGVHLEASVSCAGRESTDGLMITHKGLSGPAALNASLAWEPGREVVINWIPEVTLTDTFKQLRKDKAAGGRGKYRVWFSRRVPRRLAERIAWNAGARGSWAALSDEKLLALAKDIHEFRFIPSGTFGYKQAEVTRGGVDTREISRETMECRKIPGLFFTGEVMDVTGSLGGFNLQWAWSSGFAAGRVV